MQSNLPKDDSQYHWTNHVKGKMMQYRLSGSLIKSIINHPQRREEGIASNTIAVMRPRKIASRSRGKTSQEEIWVMYARSNVKAPTYAKASAGKQMSKVIISAWRYPGVSPVGKTIYIPDDVLEELEKWFKQ